MHTRVLKSIGTIGTYLLPIPYFYSVLVLHNTVTNTRMLVAHLVNAIEKRHRTKKWFY